MHDIDRTQLEFEGTPETGEAQEWGETIPEAAESLESPLSEGQEVELAAELLEASTEQELEAFLGNVFNAVSGATRRFIRSDTGRALGGVLKDTLKAAAKGALKSAGGGIGRWVAGTDRGEKIGTDAGGLLGTTFGLELEGLSHEDREFEVARQLVRLCAASASRAARAPGNVNPLAAARAAVASAAQAFAPGLLPRLKGRSSLAWPHSGRWVRRGRTIVLYG